MDRPFIFKERSPVAAGDRAIMDLTHASRVPVDDGQVSSSILSNNRLKHSRQEVTE